MNHEKACGENTPKESDAPLPEISGGEADPPRIWDSEELLAGRQEVLIRHHGEVYRLRLTRNDKLILNK